MSPNADLCPPDVAREISQYLLYGVPPSDFINQVLCNRLVEAFSAADENNIEAMPHIAAYLYNTVPRCAWGSATDVANIVQAGGLQAFLVKAGQE